MNCRIRVEEERYAHGEVQSQKLYKITNKGVHRCWEAKVDVVERDQNCILKVSDCIS